MMLRKAAVIFACGILGSCAPETRVTQQVVTIPAPAAAAVQPPPGAIPADGVVRRVAVAGVPLRISFFADVNADCTSAGIAKVSLATNPSHGSVSIAPADGYTNYPANNQRYSCNKQKTPGIVADYTAAKTYSGVDTFTLTVLWPLGVPVQRTFLVTVQPQS
jgi:hypothetical protein